MDTLWRNLGWAFTATLVAVPLILPVDGTSPQVVAERDARSPRRGSMEIERGKIVEIAEQQLHIEDDEGGKHAFEVATRSMILLDGNMARLSDLRVGHYATVIAQRFANRSVADQIDAITQHRNHGETPGAD